MAYRDSEGTLHRYPYGADSTRTENGMQLCREYRILALEEPAGDPAATGTQVRGDDHRTTRRADNQG